MLLCEWKIIPMPPDDDATEPDIADPQEDVPTQPDLSLVRCPKCRGTGLVIDTKEWASAYRAIARKCTLCGGKKMVDRQTHHAYTAHQQT
jgi:DnaJ-class molecular chaperone